MAGQYIRDSPFYSVTLAIITEQRINTQGWRGNRLISRFTSYKVYYLLYLMYIQHRLDNTIGKIVFRHVPKFVDSNSLLALFSPPSPSPPLHSPLYNESKTHGGDSLNQFFFFFFSMKTQFGECI